MSDNQDIILTEEPIVVDLEIHGLDEKRMKLAELLSLGRSIKEIAVQLNKSPAWVRAHKKDADVIAMVKELQAEALQSAKMCIQSSTIKAALKIEELIDSKDERIALAAATNTLDRVGLKAAEKKEENITLTYTHMSKEELTASIMERIQALRGEE
jgi:DNA-binding CsgD family transcriptional regulator